MIPRHAKHSSFLPNDVWPTSTHHAAGGALAKAEKKAESHNPDRDAPLETRESCSIKQQWQQTTENRKWNVNGTNRQCVQGWCNAHTINLRKDSKKYITVHFDSVRVRNLIIPLGELNFKMQSLIICKKFWYVTPTKQCLCFLYLPSNACTLCLIKIILHYLKADRIELEK